MIPGKHVISGYGARRKSSARRNSTLESFRQKGRGRKFSLKPEEDEEEEENKLVIKDGRVKPKSTEERAKIPKLKCSLLQDYARSRGVSEVEVEEDDLLVPERRLNLLMASPSITRRRASMMPGWSWQQDQDPANTALARGEETTEIQEEEEEEIPLLAIPKMLLRRASTQLGFKGLGSLTEQGQEMRKVSKTESGQSGQKVISEETMEEMEGDEILEVKCWLDSPCQVPWFLGQH